MRFTRLRLSGFKSFVEPTELLIEPGLTGIVGPNGCGKSNLLEALRWAMGESSTRNVRASGMDDVIFAGTATRPARNMAEVVVTVDNTERRAPAQFNGADTLEISRRIERESGSDYRINGTEVRARDVQILFADAASGARSPALVRQGQVAEIINAKPQARRRILEEAAGITGLHVRRHEAELKLRGAETNLSRIDDVVGQLETQLQGLKRQARQAIRYKELSGAIRRLEAAQLYLAWTRRSRRQTMNRPSSTKRCGCLPATPAPHRKPAGRATPPPRRFPPCAKTRWCAPRCCSGSAWSRPTSTARWPRPSAARPSLRPATSRSARICGTKRRS
jgi:chromosome segregation protein